MDLIIKVYNQYHILEMLTASVENMLVTSIDTTLETGVVPTQYIVIISTVRQFRHSDSRKLVSNVESTLVRLLISAWVISARNINNNSIKTYPLCFKLNYSF